MPNGTLKIIDHKKQIFKLSNGEYIAPENIERVATYSRFIAQCFVHGDSLKSCVIAVIVPRQKTIQVDTYSKRDNAWIPSKINKQNLKKQALLHAQF